MHSNERVRLTALPHVALQPFHADHCHEHCAAVDEVDDVLVEVLAVDFVVVVVVVGAAVDF